jgi:hypothetical protein
MPPRRLPTPDGTRIQQSVGWPSGRNYASPKTGLGLGTNSASPDPVLATCSPRIQQEATPSTVPCTSTNPGAGSIMASGRLLPRPRTASTSILSMKGRPTSPETAELTYYQRLFAILITAPTTTALATSPSG